MGGGDVRHGFLVFIPDSLISGTAAIDFGTKKGASTANGVINGMGSIGQMLGVMLPGSVEIDSRQRAKHLAAIFVGLGISLAVGGLCWRHFGIGCRQKRGEGWNPESLAMCLGLHQKGAPISDKDAVGETPTAASRRPRSPRSG